MKAPKTTKIKKEIKQDERHFGVILESMDSKIDLILEGHHVLDKKIDDNHQESREFRKEVNYKFDVVFDELHPIRGELKEKVSRDEFVVLEKRVLALERANK